RTTREFTAGTHVRCVPAKTRTCSFPARESHLGCLTAISWAAIVPLRDLPYAVEPLCHAHRVLRPVRSTLLRIPPASVSRSTYDGFRATRRIFFPILGLNQRSNRLTSGTAYLS